MDNMFIAIKYGFKSQLCEGNVLTPPHIYYTQWEPPIVLRVIAS